MREQLINDIESLPEHALQAIRVIVSEIIAVNTTATPKPDLGGKRPFYELYGKYKGEIWMSDDFDEPLEEMKEYME